jgi:UDP-glucose 4-epimerase
MRRILVTGGAGFIGSHLVSHFQDRAQVTVLDNLSSGNLVNLEGLDYTFIEDSITNRSAVGHACRNADYVFHLAAMVSVPESVADPESCTQVNVLGTVQVLEACRRAGVRKCVFASSAAVYGDDPVIPKTESMTPQPRSPYALSKLEGEAYCDLYSREYGLATSSVRFFNVFGPRQNPGSAYAAAVPIFLARAVRGDELMIHGDGLQTRDFVYVSDVVSAMMHVAEREELCGAFNVGYGQATTINALAQRAIQLTQSTSITSHVESRPGDVRYSVADCGKLHATGWRPSYGFEDGLVRTARAFASGLPGKS